MLRGRILYMIANLNVCGAYSYILDCVLINPQCSCKSWTFPFPGDALILLNMYAMSSVDPIKIISMVNNSIRKSFLFLKQMSEIFKMSIVTGSVYPCDMKYVEELPYAKCHIRRFQMALYVKLKFKFCVITLISICPSYVFSLPLGAFLFQTDIKSYKILIVQLPARNIFSPASSMIGEEINNCCESMTIDIRWHMFYHSTYKLP